MAVGAHRQVDTILQCQTEGSECKWKTTSSQAGICFTTPLHKKGLSLLLNAESYENSPVELGNKGLKMYVGEREPILAYRNALSLIPGRQFSVGATPIIYDSTECSEKSEKCLAACLIEHQKKDCACAEPFSKLLENWRPRCSCKKACRNLSFKLRSLSVDAFSRPEVDELLETGERLEAGFRTALGVRDKLNNLDDDTKDFRHLKESFDISIAAFDNAMHKLNKTRKKLRKLADEIERRSDFHKFHTKQEQKTLIRDEILAPWWSYREKYLNKFEYNANQAAIDFNSSIQVLLSKKSRTTKEISAAISKRTLTLTRMMAQNAITKMVSFISLLTKRKEVSNALLPFDALRKIHNQTLINSINECLMQVVISASKALTLTNKADVEPSNYSKKNASDAQICISMMMKNSRALSILKYKLEESFTNFDRDLKSSDSTLEDKSNSVRRLLGNFLQKSNSIEELFNKLKLRLNTDVRNFILEYQNYTKNYHLTKLNIKVKGISNFEFDTQNILTEWKLKSDNLLEVVTKFGDRLTSLWRLIQADGNTKTYYERISADIDNLNYSSKEAIQLARLARFDAPDAQRIPKAEWKSRLNADVDKLDDNLKRVRSTLDGVRRLAKNDIFLRSSVSFAKTLRLVEAKLRKFAEKCELSGEFIRQNLVQVDVHLEDYVERIREVWDYEWTDLICDIGGCLALLLGASALSMVDLFDYLLFRRRNKEHERRLNDVEFSPKKTENKADCATEV